MAFTNFWQSIESTLIENISAPQSKISLLLSGGTQSLFLAHILQSLNRPVTYHFFSFNGKNKYDLFNADTFCTQLNSKLVIHHFDLSDFVESELSFFSSKYNFNEINLLLQLKFQQIVGSDHVISAFGFPELVHDQNEIFIKTLNSSLDSNFFIFNNPRIINAFTNHPRIIRWCQLQKTIGFDNTHDWRETLIRADLPNFVSPVSGYGFDGFNEVISKAELILKTNLNVTSTFKTEKPLFETPF